VFLQGEFIVTVLQNLEKVHKVCYPMQDGHVSAEADGQGLGVAKGQAGAFGQVGGVEDFRVFR